MELLRIGETAARCRIAVRTIERLVDAGEFPRPVRIGRTRLWPAETIDTFVRGQLDCPADAAEKITM